MYYDIRDLIGKSFFVKKDSTTYRLPSTSSTPAFTVPAGGNVGEVYSYLSPTTDRPNYWLMFYDGNGKAYYLEIIPGSGNVDTAGMEVQGVKSIEQKNEENLTFTQKLPTYLFRGLVLVGVFYLGGKLIENKKLF